MKTPKNDATAVMTSICSALEWLEDQGSLDGIRVHTSVRYTNNRVDEFEVTKGRRKFLVRAVEITKAP